MRMSYYDVYQRYLKINHLLTKKQLDAILLVYHEGKTQEEASLELCICRGSVSRRLSRAKRVCEEHERQLRKEMARELRAQTG